MAQLRGHELKLVPTLECILEMHSLLDYWEKAQDSESRRSVLLHLGTLRCSMEQMLQDAATDSLGRPIVQG